MPGLHSFQNYEQRIPPVYKLHTYSLRVDFYGSLKGSLPLPDFPLNPFSSKVQGGLCLKLSHLTKD